MENFDLARGKGDISFFKGLDVSGRDWEILGGTEKSWEGLGNLGRDWDYLGGDYYG